MGKIYQKIFAKLYDPLMKGFEHELARNRQELLSPLQGKILEVGSGTGVNFQFYNPDSEVIAIEPSMPMLKIAKQKAKNYKNIQLFNYGVNDPEMDDIIAPNSLDAISCTLVLCTIPNPNLALHNFKKWLKPGGKLVVLEHLKSDKKINGKLQELVNPIWNIAGEGCNLTRNTDQLILENGFISEESSYFHSTLRWHQGVYLAE